MFAYLKGTVEDINDTGIVLENNNIGFDLQCGRSVLSSVKLHDEVKIYTHLNVREDDMSLFGFISKEELRVFRLLISISGIGPKGALSILSTLSLDELKMAVISEDFKAISKANGIGAKGAQRVVIDLKDKIGVMDLSFSDSIDSLQETVSNDNITETVMALVSLGYSNTQALQAIKKVTGYKDMPVEKLLKEALKKVL